MLKFFGLIFLLYLGSILAEDEVERFFKMVVEHDLDGKSYTKRGVININSLKSGRGDIQSELPLSNEDLRKLEKLAEEGRYYSIRISKISNDAAPSFVHSFVKACALIETGLTDKITVYLDSYGSLLGASLSTELSYCSKGVHKIPDTNSFDTIVEVSQPSVGPAPETDFYVRKLEQEKQQAKGQQVDNRSFFAKYWMYIIPAFIFMMVLNHADPSGGSGGGR